MEDAGGSGDLNMLIRLSTEKKTLSCSKPVLDSSSGDGHIVRFSGLSQSLGTDLSCGKWTMAKCGSPGKLIVGLEPRLYSGTV